MIFITAIIVFTVLIAVFRLKCRRADQTYPGEGSGWYVLTVITGFLGFVGLAIFVGSLLVGGLSGVRTERIAELSALNTGSQSSGSFFLGSGTVKEEKMFHYLKKGEGYVTLESVSARNVRVYELTAGEAPYMESRISYTDIWWLFPVELSRHAGWNFHVPHGSVDNSYVVTP